MAVFAYKLIGIFVWRAVKWYLRAKLPLGRLALGALLGLAGIVGRGLAARRARA